LGNHGPLLSKREPAVPQNNYDPEFVDGLAMLIAMVFVPLFGLLLFALLKLIDRM
jgi:hypothetical protein